MRPEARPAKFRGNWPHGVVMTSKNEDLVAISAFGDWHPDVPTGSVAVGATPNGNWKLASRYFLVPAADYKPRMPIDPARYRELANFNPKAGEAAFARVIHESPAAAGAPLVIEDRDTAIRQTCELAGKPELAPGFIASGKTVAKVTSELAARASWAPVIAKLNGPGRPAK
jgi:hypothetical protein